MASSDIWIFCGELGPLDLTQQRARANSKTRLHARKPADFSKVPRGPRNTEACRIS